MSTDHRLRPEDLRWRCRPSTFSFDTTADIADCPINIIGQPRAQRALALGLQSRGAGYNIFVSGQVGSGRSTVVRRMLGELEKGSSAPNDLVYLHNFKAPDQPCRMLFAAGKGKAFKEAMEELIEGLGKDIPGLFESEPYRKRRAEEIEAASAAQKAKLKEFEKRVQGDGFTLVQVQMGPFVRSQLVPVVAGNPVEMDQLENLVEEGKYAREELDKLQKTQTHLKTELEGLSKEIRNVDRDLRRRLHHLDRELARPLVTEAVSDIREQFAHPPLEVYLTAVVEDILEHLDEFRESEEPGPAEGERPHAAPDRPRDTRYKVNLLADNSETDGPPVIWETAPSYRNLFGTIDRTRSENGDWHSDHTGIRGGSLLQANGGFLVLDAMDVLVEPGVWPALKRTMRHRQVEIQPMDLGFVIAGVAIKPEPVPIDVKIVMIGTQHIYRLLYGLDEDFKKIFKVKAEFAREMPLSDAELQNYACLVHKRCADDALPPFHREAVAAIVEQGVRMSGHRAKLTTRFSEIVDVIREAGYWAAEDGAEVVGETHVDRAVRERGHRVDLIEELLRERIAEGTVLLDLTGEAVGQVNGLAVLDLGDHQFALPSRITATTAMGRAGIINIDREAEMSGSSHTKGVLILSGFLRSRFAQNKPLALTASVCFEQSYGGVDGDSASSTELYALLSSLSGVPIRQGIAVTGSVNQRGEVQPIGGVNRKIEGYFDLCRLTGPTAGQGVMIPTQNLSQLMLRKDVVEAVGRGEFHVWAVSTVEQGIEVLTGHPAGERSGEEPYPADSVMGRADARLTRLAEEVGRFGPADAV